MSYCLNPHCRGPQNPDSAKFCSTCGFKLLLGDRYRALTAIGRGGFGRTFRAVDEYKPSQPVCVIKQFFPLTQSAHDPQWAKELFHREAVQLEQLGQHPQVPELLAHFEQAEYQYLVQEFIDGPNLLQELAQLGPFSEVQVWHVLNDLLPVLEFVHSHQVIHRDIKPQNIIRRSDSQQCVLVDFGAAKSVLGSDLLRTGTSIGSPEFTAPEQAIGKATFASDLYSLGITCIYLLTQVRPADLFDTQEGAWVWQQHLEQPVSPVLGNIINKLLQGPIKLRYQSATDVLRDLHAQPVVESLGVSVAASSERSTPGFTDRPHRSLSNDATSLDVPSKVPASELTTSATANPVTQLPVSQHPLNAATGRLPTWKCTHTLNEHSSWVRSIVINPDGQTFASGSGDRTVKFWQLKTGELIRSLAAHSAWIRSIAVSPDGQLLASCSNDRTVKLWNWSTGELVRSLNGHTDWVRAVAFSADGRLLASSGQDKTIRIWQVATGEPVQTLTGHAHWVVTVAFTPDGKRLLSGSRDKTIRIWDLSTGRSTVLEGHTNSVNAIVLSSTGATVASCSDDSTICLWDLATGKLLHRLEHQGAVNAIALSPDDKTLISGSQDGTIKLWCTQTGRLLQTLAEQPSWVWSVAISPDSETIVSGSWDASIKLWQQQA